MKYILTAFAAIFLAASAQADRARVTIKYLSPTSFSSQMTEYTPNGTDEIWITTIDSHGVTKVLYFNAGPHRGYTFGDPIGKETYTSYGGGGGGGRKHEYRPNGLNGSGRFTISIWDSHDNLLLIGRGTLNLPFLSGDISFSSSFDLGFSFRGFTPSGSVPTNSSNSSSFIKSAYLWPVENKEA